MSKSDDGKPTVQIEMPDTVATILDKAERVLGGFKQHTDDRMNSVERSIDQFSGRVNDRLNAIESISRRNADQVMEAKTDIREQKKELEDIRTKVVEIDVMERTCPAKDSVKKLEHMFERLDDAQDEDSKIIRLIEGKIDDYKRQKRSIHPTPYQGVKIPSSIKDHIWKIAIAIFIAFVVGVGSSVMFAVKFFDKPAEADSKGVSERAEKP